MACACGAEGVGEARVDDVAFLNENALLEVGCHKRRDFFSWALSKSAPMWESVISPWLPSFDGVGKKRGDVRNIDENEFCSP